MMKNLFAEQSLRQDEFWIAFPNISHPVAAWPANHPNYFLLGFIAALAPKFHPAGCPLTPIGSQIVELCTIAIILMIHVYEFVELSCH